MLHPIERVEAAYPGAAREQRTQGSVQVLITIDPKGLVVAVEALTGPDLLRQAAIDAVKQWKFRPVIREREPVYAMTTAMIDFRLPDEPRQRSEIDLSEQMAAAARLYRLAAQMPRSPEQILADLEQDTDVLTGLPRFYSLAQLAKAAVDAGALDKGTAYANELLMLAPQYPRNWNYGNAIHDGNMVLGRVALRHGDLAAAAQYLMEAGKTPGSSTLNSFGPNVTLAKELLEKGEREVVLKYFELCRRFWKNERGRLDAWAAIVRRGDTPNFGANLRY